MDRFLVSLGITLGVVLALYLGVIFERSAPAPKPVPPAPTPTAPALKPSPAPSPTLKPLPTPTSMPTPTPPAPTPSPTPKQASQTSELVLFFDDFESGTLDRWYVWPPTMRNVRSSNIVAHSGKRSGTIFAFDYKGPTTYIKKQVSGQGIFTFKLFVLVSIISGKYAAARLDVWSGGSLRCNVCFTEDSLYYNDGQQGRIERHYLKGQWIEVEIRYKEDYRWDLLVNRSQVGTNLAMFWQDGTLGDPEFVITGGRESDPPTPYSVDFYFDDVTITCASTSTLVSTPTRQPLTPASKWTLLAPAPPVSSYSGAVWTGGDDIFAYQGGGLPNFSRYSISRNSWTQLAPFPDDKGQFCRDLIWLGETNLYTVAVEEREEQLGLWRYQIPTNSWHGAGGCSRIGGMVGVRAVAIIWQGEKYVFAYRHRECCSWCVTGPRKYARRPFSDDVFLECPAMVQPSADSIWGLTRIVLFHYSMSKSSGGTIDLPATLKVGVGEPLMAWVGDYIYASKEGKFRNICCYSISTNRWEDLEPLPDGSSTLMSLVATKDGLYALCEGDPGKLYFLPFSSIRR